MVGRAPPQRPPHRVRCRDHSAKRHRGPHPAAATPRRPADLGPWAPLFRRDPVPENSRSRKPGSGEDGDVENAAGACRSRATGRATPRLRGRRAAKYHSAHRPAPSAPPGPATPGRPGDVCAGPSTRRPLRHLAGRLGVTTSSAVRPARIASRRWRRKTIEPLEESAGAREAAMQDPTYRRLRDSARLEVHQRSRSRPEATDSMVRRDAEDDLARLVTEEGLLGRAQGLGRLRAGRIGRESGTMRPPIPDH